MYKDTVLKMQEVDYYNVNTVYQDDNYFTVALDIDKECLEIGIKSNCPDNKIRSLIDEVEQCFNDFTYNTDESIVPEGLAKSLTIKLVGKNINNKNKACKFLLNIVACLINELPLPKDYDADYDIEDNIIQDAYLINDFVLNVL